MPRPSDLRTRNYLYAVFALTWGMNLYLYLDGGYASGLVSILLPIQMLIPGLVAIAFVRGEPHSLADYGMKFGRLRYYIAAYLLMVGSHALHSLLAVLTGLGRFAGPGEGLATIVPDLDINPGLLLLLVFAISPVQNILFGLGEEFGWRGYLVSRLLPHGLTPTILVSGFVWGLWHAPVILMGHNFPEAPVPGVFAMILTSIPLGTIFIWLRLKSKSAIVVGFAHGTFNATVFLGGVFVPEVGLFWTNPVGLTGFPVFAIIAGLLFRLWPVDLPSPDPDADMVATD